MFDKLINRLISCIVLMCFLLSYTVVATTIKVYAEDTAIVADEEEVEQQEAEISGLPNTTIDAETLALLNRRMWDAVVFKSGQNYAYVRNSKKMIDATGGNAPYLRNEQAFIPLRFLGESLNSRVIWNETLQNATLYYMQTEYVFSVDSNIMDRVNPNGGASNPFSMDAKTEIVNGSVYIPISAFAQDAGFKFGVDSNNGLIWFSHTELFGGLSKEEQAKLQSGLIERFKHKFESNKTQAVYFVDNVQGQDSLDGSQKTPFKSIEKARQTVRELIQKKGMSGNIIVYLRGGSYFMDQPIVFDEKDSGQNGYKVIYKAYENETPTLNGGRRIEGWQPYDGNIFVAYVGNLKAFNTLFENGQFARKARYPNMKDGKSIYNKAIAYRDATGAISRTQFSFNSGDFPAVSDKTQLEISKWDGGLAGYQRWFQDVHKVSNIYDKIKTVEIIGNARFAIGTGTAYYIQGAMEFLDQAGEFYLSNNGYLYYWPMDHDIENQEIVAPVSDGLIIMKGSDTDNIIRDITFEGITLQNGDRDSGIRALGYDNAAVRMTNAAWITFDKIKAKSIGSVVFHVGGEKTGGWAQNNTFTNSQFTDMGKDGIILVGKGSLQAVQATDSLQGNSIINRYNMVYNNSFYNSGIITGHAYTVGVSYSGYNYIAHNRINKSTRYGVQLIDYKVPIYKKFVGNVAITDDNVNNFAYTRFNVVEYNDISECFSESQDVGAINMFETGENNIIRNNIIYNNTIRSSHAHLIYLDNDCDKTYVYNNIMFDNHELPGAELRSNFVVKGRFNQLFNNVMVDNETRVLFRTIPHGVPGLNFDNVGERNIAYNVGSYLADIEKAYDGNEKLPANQPDRRFASLDFNVLYNPQGKYIVGGTGFKNPLSYSEWKSTFKGKNDTQTIINQDPLFMNKEKFDYRLRYDSVAYMQNIRNIDISDVGLRQGYPFAVNGAPLDKIFVETKDNNNNSFVAININQSTPITVKAVSKNGSKLNVNDDQVRYSIDDTNIAEISSAGVITAKSKGVATLNVFVTINGVEKHTTFNILVDDNLLDCKTFKLRIPSTRWEIGMKRQAQAVISTELGRYKSVKDFNLQSTDSEIISVDKNGNLTAKKEGNATITATYSINGIMLSDSIGLIVKQASFKSVKAVLSDKAISIGQKSTLNISAIDTNSKAFPMSFVDINVKALDETAIMITEKSKGIYELEGLKNGWGIVQVVASADDIKQTQQINVFIKAKGEKDEQWKLHNYSIQGFETKGTGAMYKDGTFDIVSNGENIWGNQDKFTYLYKETKQDNPQELIEIYSKMLGWPTDDVRADVVNNAQIGLMFRSKDTPESANVALRIMHSTGGIRITTRKEDNAASNWKAGVTTAQFPVELKLIKQGNLFRSFYKGSNMDYWEELDGMTVEMNKDFYAGVLAYSSTKVDDSMIDVGAFGTVEIRRGNEVQIPKPKEIEK